MAKNITVIPATLDRHTGIPSHMHHKRRVAIAFKLLSTVLAGQRVICLPVHLVLVAVPICHPTLIRAELLLLSAGILFQRFTTLLTNRCAFRRRMAAQMGFHRIG